MRQIGRRKRGIFLATLVVVALLSGCLGGGTNTPGTYKLTITVLNDALGTPLEGALVEVVGKDLAEQETNADGQVSFSGLSGSLEIMVRSVGFISNSQSVVMDRERSITVRLVVDPDDPQPKEVVGPRFATVSKWDGHYFNFEQGEASLEAGKEDLRLTWVQHGNEYTLIGFDNCNGVRFSVDNDLAYEDPELVLEHFRSVEASDWESSEPDDVIVLDTYDTLILKTNTGRLVKLLILEIRGHWQHDDAAAVDFVYLFLDEVDLSPPVLESVTLVTESDVEITRPIHGGVIEFEIEEDPQSIYFTLNEVAYNNRPLARDRSMVSFSPPYRYLGSPFFSREFAAGISVYGMNPPWSVVELTAGDEAFYAGFDDDQGYFFSDLFGNELRELPFDKIVIKRAVEN